MGAWCDRCYRVVRWTHPGTRVWWLAAAAVGLFAVWRLLGA
jgi:hypothetical protein